MKKLLVLGICLVLALSILTVACGDETTTTTAAPQSTTTAAPQTTTTAAPQTTTTAAQQTTTSAAATIEPIELSMVSFIPDIPPGGNWARDFTDEGRGVLRRRHDHQAQRT